MSDILTEYRRVRDERDGMVDELARLHGEVRELRGALAQTNSQMLRNLDRHSSNLAASQQRVQELEQEIERLKFARDLAISNQQGADMQYSMNRDALGREIDTLIDQNAKLREALKRTVGPLSEVYDRYNEQMFDTSFIEQALALSPAELVSNSYRLAKLQRVAEAAEREIDALIDQNAKLRDELTNIANADPRKWHEDMRDEFQAWAQSRAKEALAELDAKGGE